MTRSRTMSPPHAVRSGEVSFIAQALSRASSKQAASVEQTSASIEQMAASTDQNTQNRKVAERSQVAAQEIGQLAANSVSMAERAGAFLDEIVPATKKTADLVQEITSASEGQTTGVGKVSPTMNRLNQITQQNASASEEMSSQAGNRREPMGFFRLVPVQEKR